MRHLSDSPFSAPGTNVAGRFLRRAPGATHCRVLVYPAPTPEFPPPAGLTMSHPVLHWMDDTQHANAALLDHLGAVLAQEDLTDPHPDYLAIPDAAEGLSLADGGGAGAASIVRGVVMWFADDRGEG